MTRNSRQSGFSLVELLVVITIIGMIIGLLIPAVNAAREAFRLVKCTSNVGELVKAATIYESNKGRFPSMVDSKSYPYKLSWPVQLFPYIGRNDLWDVHKNGIDSLKLIKLDALICPSDSGALQATGPVLNYVANANLFRDRLSATDNRNSIALTAAKSPGQTPLISERPQIQPGGTATTSRWDYAPGPWAPVNNYTACPADPSSNTNDYNTYKTEYPRNVLFRLGFDWPLSTASASPVVVSGNSQIISSCHRGAVVVGFCDGSVQKLKSDVDMRAYQCGPLRQGLQ